MKRGYLFSTILLILLISFNSVSQEVVNEEFKPHGKAILKVFIISTQVFLTYKYEAKFIGGLEYNYQFNYKFQDGKNRPGYSVYGSYYFTRQWQVFARFDQFYQPKRFTAASSRNRCRISDLYRLMLIEPMEYGASSYGL